MAFTKFHELPPELRELIWKAALPSSRVILLELKERHFDDEIAKFVPRIDRIGVRADTPIPTILLASREAKAVACRYYCRAFTNETGTSIAQVYFDFANDFLYLGPEWVGPGQPLNQDRILYVLRNEIHSCDLSRVKNLVVWWDSDNRGGFRTLVRYLLDILECLGNVSHIILVSKIYRASGLSNQPGANAKLKLLDGTSSPTTALKVHGKALPGSSQWTPTERVDVELQRSRTDGRLGLRPKEWKVPKIEYNMIVTPSGEEHLLELANDTTNPLPWKLEWDFETEGGIFRRQIMLTSDD
jgi:hypothetical protein